MLVAITQLAASWTNWLCVPFFLTPTALTWAVNMMQMNSSHGATCWSLLSNIFKNVMWLSHKCHCVFNLKKRIVNVLECFQNSSQQRLVAQESCVFLHIETPCQSWSGLSLQLRQHCTMQTVERSILYLNLTFQQMSLKISKSHDDACCSFFPLSCKSGSAHWQWTLGTCEWLIEQMCDWSAAPITSNQCW